jgi:hypothetical protein
MRDLEGVAALLMPANFGHPGVGREGGRPGDPT